MIVFGDGARARQAAAALRASPAYCVAAMVPDAPRALEQLVALCRRFDARTVVIANAPLAPARRLALDAALAEIGAVCCEMPGVDDILAGRVAAAPPALEIADLLCRPSAEICPLGVRRGIEGGAALVTGAGGSIGSALCRQLLACAPRRLVLYEMSEFALYQIDQELRALKAAGAACSACEIIPVLGSVCDQDRLESAITRHGVTLLYHAAAYKHVPLVEANVVEGVRNNVLGTRRVAAAARACGVRRMVLVSTDKAVRPTSVMGATKRVAEMIVQDAQNAQAGGGGTVFSIVRFGNVLGSSGSVIPLFRAQIERGGPVTVTHPEMTRYFMTIPEAASLVIQAGAMAEGGEVYLLDMGEPVRILDLAKRMIALSGRRPLLPGDAGAGIPIVFTGMRDGEKLYEELLIDENVLPSHHPMIARAREACPAHAALAAQLARIEAAATASDAAAAVAALAVAVPQYRPSGVSADAAGASRGEDARAPGRAVGA